MSWNNIQAISAYPAFIMRFIHDRLSTPGARTVAYDPHKEILDRLEADGMIKLTHHANSARTSMRRTPAGATAAMVANRIFNNEPLSDKGRGWVAKFGHHEYVTRFPPDSEELMDGLNEAVQKGLYIRGDDKHYRTFMGRHMWHEITGKPRPDQAPPPEPFNPYAEMAIF